MMTHRLYVKRHNWPPLLTILDEMRFYRFETFCKISARNFISCTKFDSTWIKSEFFNILFSKQNFSVIKFTARKFSSKIIPTFFVYFEGFNDLRREIKSSFFFQFLMTGRLVYSMKLDLHFGPQNGILNSFIKDKLKIKARPWLIYEIYRIPKNKF